MRVSSEKHPSINSIVPELLGKKLLGMVLSVYYLKTTFDTLICFPFHKNMSLAIKKKKKTRSRNMKIQRAPWLSKYYTLYSQCGAQ